MNNFKRKYLEGLIEDLTKQFHLASQSASDSQSEANAHKGAMASRYDTFKEEAQYLSVAQRLRADSLLRAINETKELLNGIDKIAKDSVAVGSFVTVVDQNDVERHYLIIPYGSGDKLQINDAPVIVIGKDSPIAKALIGCTVGEEAEIVLPSPSGAQSCAILAIG